MSNNTINEMEAMENTFRTMLANENSTTEKENAMRNNDFAQRIMNASCFEEFDADAREQMHDDFEDVLTQWGGWRYNSDVLYDIIDTWFYRKRNMIAQMSYHPNFDEQNFSIRLDNEEYTREVDNSAVYDFNNWICHCIKEKAEEYRTDEIRGVNSRPWDYTEDMRKEAYASVSEEHKKEMALCIVLRVLTAYAGTYIEEHDVDNLLCGESAWYFYDYDNATTYAKFLKDNYNISMSVGQKRTKVVRNIAKQLGLLERMEMRTLWNNELGTYETKEINAWNKEYAAYCDALNPLKVPAITVISANFIDFMLQSNGDSWSSCHNIDKETYHGCNCSGSMSYALDETSLQMHTYLPKYAEKVNDIKFAGKHKRVIIHMGHDLKYFVFSCVYPERTETERDKLLPVFEKVWADCLGIPNYWKSKSGSSLVSADDGCTAYHDWAQEYCNGKTVRPIDYDEDAMERIYAGACPICVECGAEHQETDTINCCHSNTVECPNCGTEYDDEDMLYYSRINEQYVCEDCATYCEYEDDWEYNGYVTWVDSVDSYVSNDYLSEHFYYCSECNEYYPEDEVTETIDGDWVCNSCIENGNFAICEDCGLAIDLNLHDAHVTKDGDVYCSYCAEHYHADEFEENEEVA